MAGTINTQAGDAPAMTTEDPVENATTGSAAGTDGTSRDKIREGATKFAQQTGDKVRDYVAQGKSQASGALGEVSRLMDDAANTVDEKLGERYGQYARSAASSISGFSETLQSKSVDELIDDARAFVTKSPVVAIGIAAALGFVISRVVKSGLDGNE